RGTREGYVTTLEGAVGDDIVGPVSGRMIPPPSKSGRMAVIDFASPGSMIMYREYKPLKGDLLKFRWAVVNWARDFYVQPDTTSANVVRNQHFRVDIVEADAARSTGFDWFDTPSFKRDELFSTALHPDKVKNVMNAIGEPPFRDAEPWQTSRFDLTPFAGKKILVLFRAVANQGPMSVVLDDVAIVNDFCTPPSYSVGLTSGIGSLPEAVGVEVEGSPCLDVCGIGFAK
ncbi:hypothetical protein HDU67_001476, partial [Dinochytrium kinnereticum]